MNRVHGIEMLAIGAGLLLLTSHALMRVWSASSADQGIAAFRAARDEHVDSQRRLDHAHPDTSTWSAQRVAAYRESLAATRAAPDSPTAVLRIPSLKLEVPVYADTGKSSLNRGAGHIEGTDAPGGDGNVGVAAHRDGFFRALKDVEVGDSIYLDVLAGTIRYQVSRIDIVDPGDVWVLNHTDKATITLVTCYPFYYVGSAPRRYVVRGETGKLPPRSRTSRNASAQPPSPPPFAYSLRDE